MNKQTTEAAPAIVYDLITVLFGFCGLICYLSSMINNPLNPIHFSMQALVNLFTPHLLVFWTVALMLIGVNVFLRLDNIYKSSYLDYGIVCYTLLIFAYTLGAKFVTNKSLSAMFFMIALPSLIAGCFLAYSKETELNSTQFYIICGADLVLLFILKFACHIPWLWFLLDLLVGASMLVLIYFANSILAKYTYDLEHIFKAALSFPSIAFSNVR